jgi:DNA/RNA-binding domain of Phe-tRNA-synthetase-like protein
MKFLIDPKVFETFENVTIGVVICKGIVNKGESKEIEELLSNEIQRIRSSYDSSTLSQDPKINVWREAYRKFGAKPKDHKSSIENLYARILKGEDLRHINLLVDIYNYISLKYMLPAGGEDLNKIQGDIILTFASDNESPMLLLGDHEEKTPHAGEVIYKDEISTICRRWNWREADRTKLTEDTDSCILVIEGIGVIDKEEVKNALEELKEKVLQYCSGNIQEAILDSTNNSIQL